MHAPVTFSVAISSAEKKGRSAVALVAVRAPLGQAGQHRSGPVQRLDLGLLIDAQHDRVLRRGQVEADDVGDLRDQLRVGRELERLDPPRLYPVLASGARDRRVPTPRCRASSRVDQCVTPYFFGGAFSVALTTARWSTRRGRPGCGSS